MIWFIRVLMFAFVLSVFPQAHVSANPVEAIVKFFRALGGARAAGTLRPVTRALQEHPNASMGQLGEAFDAMDAKSLEQLATTLGHPVERWNITPRPLATKTQMLSDALLQTLFVEQQRTAVARMIRSGSDPTGHLEDVARAVEGLDPLLLKELSIVAETSAKGRYPPRQITTTAIDICRALRHYEFLCEIKGVFDVVTSDDPSRKAKIDLQKRRLSEEFTHFGLGFATFGCATGDVCGCYDILKQSIGANCPR